MARSFNTLNNLCDELGLAVQASLPWNSDDKIVITITIYINNFDSISKTFVRERSTDFFFTFSGLHWQTSYGLQTDKSPYLSVEPCSWCECISSCLKTANLFFWKMKSISIPSKKSNASSFAVINVDIVGSRINNKFRTAKIYTLNFWTRS